MRRSTPASSASSTSSRSEILLGAPYIYSKDNIDKFDF